MAAIEKLIERLNVRRIKEATEGLRTPQGRDAYELGRLAGIQQGLTIAKQLIDEVIGEDEHEKPSSKAVPRRA